MTDILEKLSTSPFRSRFHLSSQDRLYIRQKGMEIIKKHALDFIHKRLSPAFPPHDGKQTPMRGHPVFVAQHATATCCRNCLKKWHHIPLHTPLSPRQEEKIVTIILRWIEREIKTETQTPPQKQEEPFLF